jgi:hypothetical protein
MGEQSQPVVWQIAGGPSERSYAKEFLKHGVALIGPGDSGPWSAERSDEDFNGRYVRHFVSEVKVGDVLLLRTGIAKVQAIGVVASEYMYLEQFDDVNGWDLQHARRVRWLPFAEGHEWSEVVFGANPSRLSRTRNEKVVEFALRFMDSEPSHWRQAPLPPLPSPEPALVQIPPEIADLVAEVLDHVPLYWDAERFGGRPGEDELLAHLVIPFFKAFGWTSELIGIEWENIDVVLFDSLPRRPEAVRYVVEVKRIGAGIEGALEQAKSYVAGLDVLCDIIVTDGIRYRLYSGQNGFEPKAYANLCLLKERAVHLFSLIRHVPKRT